MAPQVLLQLQPYEVVAGAGTGVGGGIKIGLSVGGGVAGLGVGRGVGAGVGRGVAVGRGVGVGDGDGEGETVFSVRVVSVWTSGVGVSAVGSLGSGAGVPVGVGEFTSVSSSWMVVSVGSTGSAKIPMPIKEPMRMAIKVPKICLRSNSR